MKVKSSIAIIAAVLLYILLVVMNWENWLHSIGPDFISQVNIAKQYADGHFKEAVNGWWSPLFNWLLAIFLKTGLDDFTAFRTLDILGGVAILYTSGKIIEQLISRHSWLLPALAPAVAFYAVSCDSTDVLSLLIFLLFIFGLIRFIKQPGYAHAGWLGIICGMGYLAKTYLLYYFLLLLGLMMIHRLLHYRKKKQELFYLSFTAILFVGIAVSWALVIQDKYGVFAFTTRGRFTSMEIDQHQLVMPMEYIGLTAPPNPYAISAWNDPVVYVDSTAKQNLNAKDLIPFIRSTVLPNIKGFLKNHISAYQLLLLLILIPFLTAARIKALKWLTLAGLLYPTGYWLFHNEDRFFWPVLMMLMIVIAIGWEIIFEKITHRNFFKIASGLLLILLFSYRPWVRTIKEPDKTFLTYYDPVQHNSSATFLQKRRFATINMKWADGLYATYALGGIYYGKVKPALTKEAVMQSIVAYDIDCMVVPIDKVANLVLPSPISIIRFSRQGWSVYCYK